MKRPLWHVGVTGTFVFLFAAMAVSGPDATSAAKPSLLVGLRRSSYGQASKNGDDAWWVQRAKQFAAAFPDAQPAIVQIVSTYQDDGTTQFGFARPQEYAGSVKNMAFARGRLDHERALSLYDQSGVKAVIQFEPGSADVADCIRIAHQAFGKHPCVVGFGVDAEWFCTKASRDKTGVPITDDQARQWMETLQSLNPSYTLFLKHWKFKHMPPTYRHQRLWFLSDSQQFKDDKELLADFKRWAKSCKDSTTGFQFGYPDDRKWWSKIENPPRTIGRAILDAIPSCRYLFWVDFTADKVQFEDAKPKTENEKLK